MTRYLLTRSEGTIGEITHLLMDAAVAAIESGEEAVNQATLLMSAYAGPTERRRLAGRAGGHFPQPGAPGSRAAACRDHGRTRLCGEPPPTLD
jgi:hypothetical protein